MLKYIYNILYVEGKANEKKNKHLLSIKPVPLFVKQKKKRRKIHVFSYLSTKLLIF